jgi:hypothetical protein
MRFHKRALRSLVVAAAVIAAAACTTGPKDTLSGDWTGSGFSLSLRQSGSMVTGTSCSVVPVSGSVRARDFTLAIDTGASAVNYSGTFINATTIAIEQISNVAYGQTLLYKGAPILVAECIVPQT